MISTTLQDGIATVIIDQPGRSMNVMDWAFADAFGAEIDRLAEDPAVQGIILTSGKPSFVVGADLSIMRDFTVPGLPLAEAASMIRRFGDPLRRMERCGKPVVGAAPGSALGGGLEILLACQYRIAADTPEARFGLPEVGLGLLPGAGGTQRLPRMIGLARALRLLTTGSTMDAKVAREAGLLDELVAPEDLIPAARRALREGRVPAVQPWDRKGYRLPGPDIGGIDTFTTFIMANAAVSLDPGPSYPAPGAILSCLFEGARLPFDKALLIESQYFARLVTGGVSQALIAARFFLRQRMAKRGQRKADPGHPFGAALREAMAAEAARIVGEGTNANMVNHAALRAGLPPQIPAAPSGGGEPVAPRELDRIANRLLVAGALFAVAGFAGDPDAGDQLALDLAGYPHWTGGPFHMIDAAGLDAFATEAQEMGFALPDALSRMGPFRDAGGRA